MAATAELIKGQFGYQEAWGRTQIAVVASGQTILAGTMGVVVTAVGGTPKAYSANVDLTTVCTTVPGTDANGGTYIYAKQGNVKFSITNGAAIAVAVTRSSTYLTVAVTAITGTSTAAAVSAAIEAHALASTLVATKATGTGAGTVTAFVEAAVAEIYLAGLAEQTYAGYNDAGSAADVTWASTALGAGLPCIFDRGIFQFAPKSGGVLTAGMVGTQCGVYDNNTIRTPPAALDLLVQLRDVDPQTSIVYGLI